MGRPGGPRTQQHWATLLPELLSVHHLDVKSTVECICVGSLEETDDESQVTFQFRAFLIFLQWFEAASLREILDTGSLSATCQIGRQQSCCVDLLLYYCCHECHSFHWFRIMSSNQVLECSSPGEHCHLVAIVAQWYLCSDKPPAQRCDGKTYIHNNCMKSICLRESIVLPMINQLLIS